MSTKKVVLNHGAGGRQMQELIEKVIVGRFKNDLVTRFDDSSVLMPPQGMRLAMTTDSYVVSPLFFPGGDIGRLCVSGTVNDLLTAGATPKALSLALILEEGLPLSDLEKILESCAKAAQEAQVMIITGDTKVVERGKGDGIYINTCGIGFIKEGVSISSYNANAGDALYITGEIGVHEVALMKARKLLPFEVDVVSDVAPLWPSFKKLLENNVDLHVVKDPTRGGVAQSLFEIKEHSQVTIVVDEEALPLSPAVRGVCELAGFDPLYLANEGKFLIVAPPSCENEILGAFPNSKKIGTILEKEQDQKPELLLKTINGGLRKLGPLETIQLPRIC